MQKETKYILSEKEYDRIHNLIAVISNYLYKYDTSEDIEEIAKRSVDELTFILE